MTNSPYLKFSSDCSNSQLGLLFGPVDHATGEVEQDLVEIYMRSGSGWMWIINTIETSVKITDPKKRLLLRVQGNKWGPELDTAMEMARRGLMELARRPIDIPAGPSLGTSQKRPVELSNSDEEESQHPPQKRRLIDHYDVWDDSDEEPNHPKTSLDISTFQTVGESLRNAPPLSLSMAKFPPKFVYELGHVITKLRGGGLPAFNQLFVKKGIFLETKKTTLFRYQRVWNYLERDVLIPFVLAGAGKGGKLLELTRLQQVKDLMERKPKGRNVTLREVEEREAAGSNIGNEEDTEIVDDE